MALVIYNWEKRWVLAMASVSMKSTYEFLPLQLVEQVDTPGHWNPLDTFVGPALHPLDNLHFFLCHHVYRVQVIIGDGFLVPSDIELNLLHATRSS